MSERERNAQLLREGIAAFNRGETETLKARLDPGIESHVASGLGNPGTWHGIEGYDAMTGAWGEAFQSQRLEVVSIEFPAGDGQMIAEIRIRAVGAGSGVPVEMRLFYLLEVRDERVVRFHIYGSREAALDAVR